MSDKRFASIPPGVRRLFRLDRKKRRNSEQDVDDEILFHIEQRTSQLIARGADPIMAREEAERRFGNLLGARDTLRQSARRRDRLLALGEFLHSVTDDARVAVRGLRRSPSFLTVAVACLALGIGANVAIFSVLDGVLLKSLPFPASNRLASVWPEGSVPPGIYELLVRDQRSFSQLAGYEPPREISMSGDGEPMRIMVSRTSVNLFETLGVAPQLGRGFRIGDEKAGSGGVAVLSHALWRDRFGKDSSILGQSLKLNGVSNVIIGVMPEAFDFPDSKTAIWTAIQAVPGSAEYWWTTFMRVVGRLKPDVTLAAATSEMAVLLPQARASFPIQMPEEWGKNVKVVSLHESITRDAARTLLLLFAAVALVLLIACVNVATLYIGRSAARSREIAVRAALGGGRSRIVRLLFTESCIVAVLGAVAGLVLASVTMNSLVAMLPSDTPRLSEIHIDGRVLVFTILLTVIAAVGFGLLPSLRISRRDLSKELRAGGRTGGSARQAKSTSLLAAIQIALAVMLVSGAGLLGKSLWKLQHLDTGFRSAGILTASIPLPSFPNDTATRTPVFHESLLRKVRDLPGVDAVALVSALPFGDGIQNAAMSVESHPTAPGNVPPLPFLTSISANYFSTLDIPIIEGRAFDANDRSGSLRVAIVDATAAREYWPTEPAIGQRIKYVWDRDWFTVVGIVADIRHDSLSGAGTPSVYIPVSQSTPGKVQLVLSTNRSVSSIAADIKTAVKSLDAGLPVGNIRPLESVLDEATSRSSFTALLISLLAAIALLLGAVGIYGVMAAGVSRRTREIGVRMAVGATGCRIARMVLREALTIALIGASAGLICSLLAARLIRGMLFQVQTIDLGVFISVTILLTAVAVGAALAPAIRAAGMDPLSALREE